MDIAEILTKAVGSDNILFDEPMSDHTTFKIGGKADYFVMPDTAEKIKQVIDIAKQNGIDYYIIGNGSNLLVRDGGYRGIIIQIFKNFSNISVSGDVITCQSGALLSAVSREALGNSLAGMEFASGIPGTVGGAVCMNAGAYGGEMKNIVVKSTVLKDGKIFEISNADSDFGYRHSKIMDQGMIVLEAVIKLEKGSADSIKEQMAEYTKQRVSKQPLEYPSAGSTFKRPTGYFAGKLIDDSGLRGYAVGGAQVSEKHCGFVINKGGASAADVIKLMDDVSGIVYEKFGVRLEPEVRIIGSP